MLQKAYTNLWQTGVFGFAGFGILNLCLVILSRRAYKEILETDLGI